MRVTQVFAFAALVVATQAHGCKDDTVAREAKAIALAYDAFQNAGLADRRSALEAFARVGCTGPSCADRDACVSYATPLLRAQELVSKAKSLGPVDAGGNGVATDPELAIIVSSADDFTAAATAAEPACREALTRLQKRARGEKL